MNRMLESREREKVTPFAYLQNDVATEESTATISVFPKGTLQLKGEY